MAADLHEYQWLVVIGAFAAFAFGFGTGANDVANAFGTSVGSKTLTLRQAVTIAAVFEFVGALVLGRVSTSVIAGGIADITEFYREPEIYAYGMICALIVGAVWQILASYLELNVSATHSIIGGIMGFALVYAGKDGVLWAEKETANFPPYKGVLPIILSWFIAPILSAAAAAIIFFLCRTVILRNANSFNMSFWLLPVAVLITTWINMYFVFTKGLKKTLSENNDSWPDSKAVWVALCIAAGCALLTCLAIPFLKKRIVNKFAADESAAAQKESATAVEIAETGGKADKVESDSEFSKAQGGSWFNKAKHFVTHGTEVDVHECIEEDEKLSAMHHRAEVFDAKTEHSFSYLQVFSACCVIFAHGAGEVGYMAGPLATIWDVYRNGTLTSKVKPPIWVVIIGALGLVVGLYTYGYNVTRSLGVKLAKLSPTRGFAAELATAVVITVAAQYGLPNSSSQVITGAVVGVGLLEGTGGVNWTVFARQFASWVATLVVVGLCVAALFAQGVYTPSIQAGKNVMFYEDRIQNVTATLYSNVNTTLLAYKTPALANQIPTLTPDMWAQMNATVANSAAANKALIDNKKAGTTEPEALVSAMFNAMAFVQKYTINTIGQVDATVGAPICNSNATDSLLAATGEGFATAACPAFTLTPKGYESFLVS